MKSLVVDMYAMYKWWHTDYVSVSLAIQIDQQLFSTLNDANGIIVNIVEAHIKEVIYANS